MNCCPLFVTAEGLFVIVNGMERDKRVDWKLQECLDYRNGGKTVLHFQSNFTRTHFLLFTSILSNSSPWLNVFHLFKGKCLIISFLFSIFPITIFWQHQHHPLITTAKITTTILCQCQPIGNPLDDEGNLR